MARSPADDAAVYRMDRQNLCRLPADYPGPLYVWDVDNTYLLSEYRSLRDLLRIRFESAEDKQTVSGAPELVRALRGGQRPPAPVYFISASPKTLRAVLEQRLRLDGVEHDGLTLRDLTRFRYLRDIVGYKLAALLLLRSESSPSAAEILFGDDREHDPYVYQLYCRVCAGALRGAALSAELKARGVRSSAAGRITALAATLPEVDLVQVIFIRCLQGDAAQRSSEEPAAGEAPRDPRVLYFDHYLQAAVALLGLGKLSEPGFSQVGLAVLESGAGEEPLALLPALGEALTADGRERAERAVARLLREHAARPPEEGAP